MYINEDDSAFNADMSLNHPFGIDFGNDLSFCYESSNPEVSLSIPANAKLAINIEPDLTTSGEFTDLEDEEDTVKSDPFGMSTYTNPGDIDDTLADEADEVEAQETRYITLDDLM